MTKVIVSLSAVSGDSLSVGTTHHSQMKHHFKRIDHHAKQYAAAKMKGDRAKASEHAKAIREHAKQAAMHAHAAHGSKAHSHLGREATDHLDAAMDHESNIYGTKHGQSKAAVTQHTAYRDAHNMAGNALISHAKKIK
jgi:hypothetical protein